MKKYIYLLKNIGLLTISSFTSSILSFLLVPLYTSVLSTTDYGIYDIFNTTIMLCIPIFTVGIIEAVLRFSLDKDNNAEEIFAIGNSFIIRGFLILVFLLILNYIFNVFAIVRTYSLFFLLLYAVTSFSQLLQYYARGREEIASLAVAGILSSIVTLTLNILLLLVIRLGLRGYFIASIIGLLTPGIYLSIKMKVWEYIIPHPNLRYRILKRKMVDYSWPMVINSISWWINNSSSRYIIIFLCGISENGLFSVGNKIPTILNVFQQIFNQAWVLSSVDEFDPEDSKRFFIKTYNVYNFMMVITCSILILSTKILARILYAKGFYVAWKYVPFLMIAIVFSAVSGLLGGIFSAVKDSKAYSKTTVVGAIVNIFTSFALVYVMGAIGASIGNAFSFFIVWAMRVKIAKKYMNLRINLVRDNIVYFILVIQAIIIIYVNNTLSYFLQGLCVMLIVFAYRKELINLRNNVKLNLKRG